MPYHTVTLEQTLGPPSMTVVAGKLLALLLCWLATAADPKIDGALSRAIDKVLSGGHGRLPSWVQYPKVAAPYPTDLSHINELCSYIGTLPDNKRLACCSTVNGGIVYLNNVQLSNGRIVLYTGGVSETSSFTSRNNLPPINSVTRRVVKEFTLHIERKPQRFSEAKCTSYFNGTLHVVGRQTTQNLYHVLNDNLLPLLTHVVFDAALAPELLHAPRALLTGFQPPADNEQVPHLEAVLRAAFPKRFALGAETEGVCFRRIAWGGGVKVMYQHLLGAVRRLSAELLRQVLVLAFQPPNPYLALDESRRSLVVGPAAAGGGGKGLRRAHKGEQLAESKRSVGGRLNNSTRATAVGAEGAGAGPLADMFAMVWRTQGTASSAAAANTERTLTVPSKDGQGSRRPLNVVIFTRGSSGVGRTIGNEVLLRDRLVQLGARAVICCDFRAVTLPQQLGYAMHADVVVGLHGAGLVNSIIAPDGVITVELKTAYGYGLTLFALATEARRGTFIEVDVRDHHIWGKPGQGRNHPVDEDLVGRVVAALQLALHRQEEERRNSTITSALERRSSAATLGAGLFMPLPRPPPSNTSESGPRKTGKALGGGDLAVFPFPAVAYDASALPAAADLDYLRHLLGPTVAAAPAQCAAMSLASYWKFVGEKGVKDKYCLACQL